MKSRFLISFKMTGLLTGLLTGGWGGMLLGLLVGWLIDRKLHNLLNNDHQPPYGKRYRSRDEQLFFQLTFQVLGFLAKADGQVSRQEIQVTEQIMNAMGLSPDERSAAIEAFNIGKQQPNAPQHLLKRFRKRFARRNGKKLEWLHYQFQLLYADGKPAIERTELLGMTAFYAGIQPEQFQILRQQYRKAWQDNSRSHYRWRDEAEDSTDQSTQQQSRYHQHRDRRSHQYSHQHQRRHSQHNTSRINSLQAAYNRLGVSADTDMAGIKKAFRQQISRVHPDKLSGCNASEAEQARAKEASQQLQAAYQLIKKSRSGKI